MSVIGFSSYFLWTEKGKTVLPLVRASAFVVNFQNSSAFNKRHIVTAAHAALPTRFPKIYSDNKRLSRLGERHIYLKALMPRFLYRPSAADEEDGSIGSTSYLRNSPCVFPHVDVCAARLRDESFGDSMGLEGFEVDTQALAEGDELIYVGLRAEEEKANPHDDKLKMLPVEYSGVCKAAFLSGDYGMCMLGTSQEPLPLSACGGPVLRRSNMKVVGVLVAQVRRAAPPADPRTELIYHDPWLDVSGQPKLCDIPDLNVAFVPVGEFYHGLRKSET